ncbi:universal stress protein [Halorhabdus amylolytica]|uniref:universal stress protein n=1 Tax=Halorhabdus amylolytica TaxID=2559573 RepID=UPI0010AAC9FD|nr:universal stress protein [Halorhabdus amylolytica]
MTETLTAHLAVPVANDEDARATAGALQAYEFDRVTAVHVVEKGGGTLDKIPLEQAEEQAEEAFEAFRDVIPDAESAVVYHTDIVEGIFEAATDLSASAIAFHPRGGSRLTQFLEGDPALKLVTEADRPVIALPEEHDE